MRKLLLCFACLAAMLAAGTGLKAQEVTIVLTPGWNWISCPSTDTLDFATALGDFTPMQGDVIKSQWGNAVFRANGMWWGSISKFYPGYGYKYYSSRSMPVFLTFNAQQPTPQVVVSTSEPMLITAISAMGGGEVTVSDDTYIIVKGLCWATHENPMTNDDFFEEAESGVGSFSISMTELNIGTTYYVRAYAVTANGTVYGNQKTFTTRDGIPTLTTADVTNIQGTTATCGGNITDNGGLNVTALGVCWSTSPNPIVANSNTANGSGTGSFSSSITGLNVNTTYYVRAYATTAAGTGYGEQKIFTTRDGVPEVVTSSVTNIYSNFATCGGTVIDDGGLEIVSKGICWSTISNPTISDCHTVNGSGLGDFTGSLIGLSFSTIYYVRAYASTSQATAYGNEVVFTSSTQVWANGILPGAFSVSPDHQVHFSQGNLQYKASTNSWRFALNQWDWVGGYCWIDPSYTCCEDGGCEEESYYDTIGNVFENGVKSNNNEISSSYSGWIDLFGWGTSGWHDSNDPYNVRYQPWSTATSTVNTSYNNYGYGPSTNMSSPNLTGSSGNYDWGVYNTISNGGNQPNQWRTLTKDEWEYVFNTRTTASGISWVIGYVNGVIGVILLPDNWNSSIYELHLGSLTYINMHGWNHISVTDWVNILEPNGAVFFPLTGYRSGTEYHFQESPDECNNDACCFYWSTSNKSNKYAYCVHLSYNWGWEGFGFECSSYRSRFRGSSVRLVCPAE